MNDQYHHNRRHNARFNVSVSSGASSSSSSSTAFDDSLLFDQLMATPSDNAAFVKSEPFHKQTMLPPTHPIENYGFPSIGTGMDLEMDMEMQEMHAALSLEMPDDDDDHHHQLNANVDAFRPPRHPRSMTLTSDDDDAKSYTSSVFTTATNVTSSPTPSTMSMSSASSASAMRPRNLQNSHSAALPPEVLAHMPLPPRADGHSDQRERNRLIVKRCYYKKISTLNQLRSELDRVELHYKELLAQKHRESLMPTSEMDFVKQQTLAHKLHQAYVELTLVSDSLRQENDQLRRVEAEYLKMEKQMAQLQLAQQKNLEQQREAHEHKKRNPIVELQKLTSQECRGIAQEAACKIQNFRESKNIYTTGANLFGWRDRHRVDNDQLSFLLEKQFHGTSVDHLESSLWTLLSQADTLAKTYSPHLDVLYHEVQRVDEDHVVFYHTLERPGSEYRIKALMLACHTFLGPEEGTLILFRGLDAKKYLIREGEPPRPRDRRGRNKIEPQKEDIWIDTFVWGIFRRAPDGQGSISDFGGIVDGTALISASWWMIEMLQFALRCETSVVGPQFVLKME